MARAGQGNAPKLANQIIVASTIASERSFSFCAEQGRLERGGPNALLGGFAQSKILDQHGLRMIEEDFQPGGTAINQLKDLVEASKVASADGLNLPMLETNKKLWERMLEDGLGELDHSGLYEWYRQSFGKKNGGANEGHRYGAGGFIGTQPVRELCQRGTWPFGPRERSESVRSWLRTRAFPRRAARVCRIGFPSSRRTCDR